MDLTIAATVANVSTPHEVESTACYTMLGITYVPHYLVKGMFVAPGNVMYPESYLTIFGAERVNLMLWPRKYP
jgi:hypothetical protein